MDAQHDEPKKRPRRGRWWKTSLLILAILVALGAGLTVLTGQLYHGPRSLDAVTQSMPGVPIFPFAEVAPGNTTAQHLFAILLFLMRLRGIPTAETALLSVPAERDFVLDWYRKATPFQDWSTAREEQISEGTRLIYTRDKEALLILIGQTHDGLTTMIQLIYLGGLNTQQLEEVRKMK